MIKYIQNFNSIFEDNYEKYGYIPSLLLVILSFYFFIFFIIILIYKFLLQDDCDCLKNYLKNLFKRKKRKASQSPDIIQIQIKKKMTKKKGQ